MAIVGIRSPLRVSYFIIEIRTIQMAQTLRGPIQNIPWMLEPLMKRRDFLKTVTGVAWRHGAGIGVLVHR